MKLLTKENLKALPPLYSTENNPEAKVGVKFFGIGNAGAWTWYAFEFDGSDTLFGLVDGHEPEWGYFSLAELSSLRWAGIPAVERDRYYTPETKAALAKRLGA
ncbi:MAG: DUF2958 domain-containing protein [Patescibacteria group bacterium]|nr:DUF2958 domain-containing protein [Patescibacteria group bacterium]